MNTKTKYINKPDQLAYVFSLEMAILNEQEIFNEVHYQNRPYSSLEVLALCVKILYVYSRN